MNGRAKINPATPSLLRKPTVNPMGQTRPVAQSLHQPNEATLAESSAGSALRRPNCAPIQRPAAHQPDKMSHRSVKPSPGD